MALIPYGDEGNPSPAVLEALENAPGAPLKLNIARMIANSEGAQTAMAANAALVMDGKLDPKLRELGILSTARACGCDYEWGHHVVIARNVGVTQAQIDSIENPQASCFNETESLVVRLSQEMAKNVKGSREAVLALNQKLGPSLLVELIMVTGFYHGLARLMETVEIELDSFHGKVDVMQASRR